MPCAETSIPPGYEEELRYTRWAVWGNSFYKSSFETFVQLRLNDLHPGISWTPAHPTEASVQLAASLTSASTSMRTSIPSSGRSSSRLEGDGHHERHSIDPSSRRPLEPHHFRLVSRVITHE